MTAEKEAKLLIVLGILMFAAHSTCGGETIIQKEHDPIVLRPPSGQGLVVIGSRLNTGKNGLPQMLSTHNPKDLLGLYEEEAPKRDTNAIFMSENNTAVTVQVGSTAALRCQVFQVAEHETVSWIRRRDHHLITIGSTTYSTDDRFQVTHDEKLQDWTLHIHFAQPRDAGVYECQLSAHPPIGMLTQLNVIEAVAVIAGGPEMYVQVGSEVHLQCNIKKITEPPTYVFWYQDTRMINYDDRRQVLYDGRGMSELHIGEAGNLDSGNYTCVPSNALPASIVVHVITGEAPAAVQRASAANFGHEIDLGIVSCLVISLIRVREATNFVRLAR